MQNDRINNLLVFYYGSPVKFILKTLGVDHINHLSY